jgi:hypothetical protein
MIASTRSPRHPLERMNTASVSPEGVGAAQVGFEYPATSVPFTIVTDPIGVGVGVAARTERDAAFIPTG